jgi:hypothetical protein
MHDSLTVDGNAKKWEIIMDYNITREGMDKS